MEELDDEDCGFGPAFPPSLVSLTPFTPSVSASPRRLSRCFTQPTKPVRAKRQLAWVSLQGRLVGAEEATSAKTIGAFGAKEAAAWELFTPIQRVLLVAIVAAAAVNSKKNKQIVKLQKSVELRDQVLLSMQQKLDNLCQQLDYFKDQPEFATAVTKSTGCGCKQREHHILPPHDVLENNSGTESNGHELFNYKMPLAGVVEPEERRMSVLSDWAPSVTSSVDTQLDDIAIEHDIRALQKECEEKDTIITKLSTSIQSSEVFSSKRNAELEDIIRRKSMIINKLRKDVLFLEQKVMSLTRLRRPTFSAASSNVKQQPSFMAENVLYDMDSTTGPSSDSDNSPRRRMKGREMCVQIKEKASKGDEECGELKRSKFVEQPQRSCATTPLKERSSNQIPNSVHKPKPKLYTSGRENRSRNQPPARSKEAAGPKRWI